MGCVLRVLIVDGDANLRASLSAALVTAGYDVSAVSSAAEAFENLRRSDPDVVLTDCRGYGLVRRIRAGGRTSGAVILVMAPERDPHTSRLMDEAGANGWFQKPVRPAQVIDVLEAVRLAAARRLELDHPVDIGAVAA